MPPQHKKARLATPGQSKLSSWLKAADSMKGAELCGKNPDLKLNRVAVEHGFRVVDMPRDGNCGLHAVVDQLSIHGVFVEVRYLREQAVSYLKSHTQLMDPRFLDSHQCPTVDYYLSKQSVHGCWVDEIMLRAISSCIGRDIHILHDNGHITKLEQPLQKHGPIFLGLIGESHYVSLHLQLSDSHSIITKQSSDLAVDNNEASMFKVSEQLGTTTTSEPTAITLNSAADAYSDHLKPDTETVVESSINDVKGDWPSVWSESVWFEKKTVFPFLICKDGKIGCKVCYKVQTASGPGIALAVEWTTCQVTPSGTDRAKQLRCLRKKIFKHAHSQTHKHAETILTQSEKQVLEKAVAKMRADEKGLTSKVFKTAYYVAKNDRPFTDYQPLLELQESNGTELGLGLRSRYTAKEIVVHIAHEMRRTACQKIIKTGLCISILIDEATTVSNKSALIIYLKCTTIETSEPHFMFLDLVEIEDQTANTIVSTVLSCLNGYGFNDAYLSEHLIAFVSDGASVMTGNKSGVAAQLAKKYPNIVTWHCLNHRLELAVGDVAAEVNGINHFRSFMDALFSLYSRSPKTQRRLEFEALQLDIQLKKIGRVLNTRWVASSFRTVRAVWDNFEALAAHFHASSDPTSTQFEKELRSKFGGLHTKLCSPQFVEDLGLMYDCLEELKSLSESLQRRNMNIPEADKLIRRSIRRFEIFKETPGQKMAEALTLRDSLLFGTTPLKSNSKHVAIHKNQFLQGLADNLRRRLMSVASNGGVTQVASGSTERQEQLSKQVITQLAVLNPHNWPNEIELNFGQDEVRLLCSRFRIQYSKVRDAFDDFKDDGGRRIPDNLKPLINSVNTIPVSTAECERGFSAMNVILSDLRSSLLLQHVSALLFVKLHGPPLQLWQPDRYVESWLTKHRLATDTRSRVAVATCADAVKNPDPLWTIL